MEKVLKMCELRIDKLTHFCIKTANSKQTKYRFALVSPFFAQKIVTKL